MGRHPGVKKFDRLLAPGSTAGEIAADFATKPYDREARALDAKWGVDRLVELVSPDMAAKFGRSIAVLNEALDEGDPAKAAAAAENCIRGLRRMDELATAAGHQPMPPEVWEIEIDGKPVVILRDPDLWPVLKAIRGDVKFYTAREVAIAVKAKMDGAWIDEIKREFPGAQVAAIRRTEPETALERDLDDALPF